MFYNFTIIIVINPVHQNFFGLVEMTYRLVHASYCLPKWQAVKLPFFAPWFKYLRSIMNVYTRFYILNEAHRMKETAPEFMQKILQ